MLYGQYRFSCRFDSEAVLPVYKGSTFRGVFGHALKRVVCALKQQECTRCLLREKCIYVQIFESPHMNSKNRPHGLSRPRPFVIEPPETKGTLFSSGSEFEFTLLLFGTTNEYLPYFIYAFEQISHIGIGKKINGKRGGFQLNNVKFADERIYSGDSKKLKMPAELPELLLNRPENRKKVFRLRVYLETPLRLKFENRLKADLPFHVLVRGMLRRISSLMSTYGNGEPDMDYKDLVKRAETVRTVDDNLEWFDWRRYSFRQEQAMLMGGMTGSVTYEGDIAEFMPIIGFCEAVHVGKQTTFGLGKIKTEVLS